MAVAAEQALLGVVTVVDHPALLVRLELQTLAAAAEVEVQITPLVVTVVLDW